MRSFKWIGKIFFLCLLAATLAVSAFAAENTTEFAGGSGTESSPYLISTKEHLNNVRNYLSAHYKLTADITFSSSDFSAGGTYYNSGNGWLPIGNSSSNFKGTFDGNGHTITGLYQNTLSSYYVGLFGSANGATIKNLGMIASKISVSTGSSSNLYVGCVVGSISGGAITNCYSTGTVTGTVTGTASTSRVYAGGIAGRSTAEISKCHNTATVSVGAGSEYVEAGGIVGYTNGGTVSECYNTGRVTGGWAGGIVGYASSITFSNCYNTGNIFGQNGARRGIAGGIAGFMSGNVLECHNTGTVMGKSSGTESAMGGGIVGQIQDGEVSFCYNTGSVTASATGESTASYAGGITGYRSSGTTSNCYSTGAVTASTTNSSAKVCAGGIAGKEYGGNGSNALVTKCYNTGKIKASAPSDAKYVYAGGVAGHTENSYSGKYTTVNYCYNVGAVTGSAKAYVGGVVGYAATRSNISNCYYLDNCSAGVAYGTGTTTLCTAAQMREKTTFTNFDFIETWTTSGNVDYRYPELVGVPMVYTKTATSIVMYSSPAKLVYEEGESLDLTGGAITVNYDNDTTERISITEAMVTGFDSSVIGKQTLTVRYSGCTVRFSVEIIEKPLSSISLTTFPAKLTYWKEKETLDVTGGKLTLQYRDGTSEEIALSADMVTGFDNAVLGKQMLTVTYKGLTDTFEIEVLEEPILLEASATITDNCIVLSVASNKELSTQPLICALYREGGQMLSYTILPAAEPYTSTLAVLADDADAKTAKVFLWESLSALTPIANAVEVTIR